MTGQPGARVLSLVVCGAGNVLLTQTAYQAGYPMVTLPVIAAVTPVASVGIGIGLLGEAPQTGVAGLVVAGLAVVIASLALARLARSAPHPEPRRYVPRPEPQRSIPRPEPRLSVPRPRPQLQDTAADDAHDGSRVLAGAGPRGR